ncbi:MAG: hypothetical protein HY366_02275 [Candidatus Aenigmarchaeota archaeon]|nr:hypothetical protein [Candidatus Aenigmarchaeota archaeon]
MSLRSTSELEKAVLQRKQFLDNTELFIRDAVRRYCTSIPSGGNHEEFYGRREGDPWRHLKHEVHDFFGFDLGYTEGENWSELEYDGNSTSYSILGTEKARMSVSYDGQQVLLFRPDDLMWMIAKDMRPIVQTFKDGPLVTKFNALLKNPEGAFKRYETDSKRKQEQEERRTRQDAIFLDAKRLKI